MKSIIYIVLFLNIIFSSIISYAEDLISGINPNEFNYLVRPQDSLYDHVNSNWLDNTPIPDDQVGWGSYMTLREESYSNQDMLIKKIIERIENNNPYISDEELKIANLYKSFIDRDKVNSLGYDPILPELKIISEISNVIDLWQYFSRSIKTGSSIPLRIFIYDDLKDPLNYTIYIDQGGLGLPDRDYYLEDNYKEIRSAYINHIENLLRLASIKNPKQKALSAFEIENELAKVQLSRLEMRDPERIYNPYKKDRLYDLGGKYWNEWVEELGLESQNKFIVESPVYITALVNLMNEIPIDKWKDYLIVRLVKGSAGSLSDDFILESFEFSKILTGREKLPDLWKRAVGLVNGIMGDALGKIYVNEFFPPEYKDKMEILVDNLLESYRIGIQELEWMSDETKKRALEKLSKMRVKIGYPEVWDDYEGLEINPDDLYGNLNNSAIFGYKKALERLNGPVDRREWSMSPQTVNAYFSPTKNEIVFPAAYLQPPNFNPKADDAVNYGAIGVTIGHEISHAFDDKGSQFDGDGNLRNWWTKEDRDNFDKRTALLANQYSQYEVLPGRTLNGELTLGENIADLGGAKAAFRAYKISLKGEPSPIIDNYTGEQRFFIGTAQSDRVKFRDEIYEMRVATSVHSPSRFRVDGVIINMKEFHKAFSTEKGDKLYKSDNDIILIW
ncbi:MAG: M13 family metallopeptidase [Pseudomonadota bacterium]|nr:M13 family metallopeptidase [Pseudomonadota bacterium]MEC8497630.1 M13 family metallopeptidase [Pseudomonadota bacterium]MEC8797772.1 M13 family metallopeptidase [Pseudomonadota bacterium]